MNDFFSQSPRTSFGAGIDDTDEMPGAGNNRRNKLVHQQGLVAKAKFVPVANTAYTGVFKGSDQVIVRMSETDLIADGISEAANPSIALKFLRTGRGSANQFGMVSFEGTSSWNFFANPFATHLPNHEGECGPKTIAKYNAMATPFIYQNGSYDMGLYDQDGNQEAVPNFPYYMEFVPTAGVPETDGNSRFFEQLNGDAIPANTTLFEVWGLDEPSTSGGSWRAASMFKIGEIVTTTAFTQSLWGDERLFFKHSRLSDDIAVRDSFRNQMTPRFNTATWGAWNDSYQVEDINEDQFL